jgi:hypothetical protein
MSRENVIRFAEFLRNQSLDENDVAATIERELHQIDNREDFIRQSVRFGNDNGFEFTQEDLEVWFTELEDDNNIIEITFPINQIDSTLASRRPFPFF